MVDGLSALLGAARREAMTPQETAVFLAASYHESGWNPAAVGDNGSSFGLFQHHVGGLGGPTLASAKRYLNPAFSASEAAARFKSAGIATGAGAAASQRPKNQSAYAQAIDSIARQILAGSFGPLNRATGGGVGVAGAKKGRVTGDTSGLNQNLLDGLRYVAGELGKTVNVVSGKRTRAEQEELWRKYQNGTGNKAAPPGTSRHETGNAADAYIDGTALQSYPGAAAAAAKFGLGFPVGGEPWHVEATGGGPAAAAGAGASGASGASGAEAAGSNMMQAGLFGDAAGGALKAVVVLVALALAAGLIFAGVTKLTGTEKLAGTTLGTIVRGAK